jgi:mRNA-degrading endonuclease RelE of RelBE toxin-antitoxin system
MKIKLSGLAKKQFKNLPEEVRKKARKQFGYLLEDLCHPSLHAKKYNEGTGLWQGRIDKSWRFYFYIIEPDYIILSVIIHPK